MMKILVTGATGFVGGFLSEALVKQGHEVTVLVLDKNEVNRFQGLDVRVARGDITDPTSLQSAMNGQHIVYHMAAAVSMRGLSQGEFRAVNVGGTENIVNAALRAGVSRFIHGSSTSIYGTSYNGEIDENTPPNAYSFYSQSKLEAEKIALRAWQQQHLPVTLIRLSSIYGPHTESWRNLIHSIEKKPFRMIGNGENYYQLCYVSDLIDGLVACASRADLAGETVILSGGEHGTVGKYVELIAQELNVELCNPLPITPYRLLHSVGQIYFEMINRELQFLGRYEMFFTNKRYNLAKARKLLGYKPKVELTEGVKRMVKWYRETQKKIT